MIIERVAIVCSLYLLNEKTSFEAMERMKGNFLEQVLSGQFSSKKEILKRGSYIQMDLDQSFHTVVLKYQNKRHETENELFFHEQLKESIFQYFKDKKTNVLIGQRERDVILLVQTRSLEMGEEIARFCGNLLQHLAESFTAYLFKAGISTKGGQIQRASEHYQEALIALKIGDPKQSVVLFEELGVTGILISSQNIEDVKRKARHLLGPLYRSDNQKHLEMLKTLYTFLRNGGNLEKTAHQLSISLSGLRYRIEKIENLLQKDLRNPEVGYELLLTLKALIAGGAIPIE